MTYVYIAIIIALITIILSIVRCVVLKKKVTTYNKDVELKNKELSQKTEEILSKYNETLSNFNTIQNNYNAFKIQYDNLNASINVEDEKYKKLLNEEDKAKLRIDNLNNQEKIVKNKIADISLQAEQALTVQKNLAISAFEQYCDKLDNDYAIKEAEYMKLNEMLLKAYDEKKESLRLDAEKTAEDLEKIRSTRAAAIEALRREKEILSDSSYYCIEIADEDKADIARLESIKKTLNKPRVLSMLIWSTYFQKPLKQLAANILGPNTVTGIYKITNVITGEVYIGQAVDVASRWSQHCKAGLGIDTPAGNKLYKAMTEYGVYSFSWELMEECSVTELNAKERFYIDLYQSVDYGYNILKGNS